MKKLLTLILVGVMLVSIAVCSAPGAGTKTSTAKYHIGIVTGTYSQSEDEPRGAEALIKEYGDVKNGGMIKHITYPDNFASELETTISVIAGLADDPLMKAMAIGIALGALIGYGYGQLLNRVKGDEMIIATYVGFAVVAFMSIMWVIFPFKIHFSFWATAETACVRR